MNITRTYPQPDSNLPHIGPRERAMAVFKYLLDLEPEAAVLHPLFACIVHSYKQVELTVADPSRTMMKDSLVPMLSSEQPVEFRAHPYYDGKL